MKTTTPTPDELRAELAATGTLSSNPRREADIETVKVKALINIGETLLAIFGALADPEDVNDDDDGDDGHEPREWVPAVNDEVRRSDDFDDLDVGVITHLGVSEDSLWADVDWGSSGIVRCWVDGLVKHNPDAAVVEGAVVDAEGIPVLASSIDEPAAADEADDEGDDDDELPTPADLTDDINADFTDEVKPMTKKELKALRKGQA